MAVLKKEGKCVFHLHHLNAFFKDARSETDAWKICTQVMASLDDFTASGGTLVWTAHNRLSHDTPFIGPELRLRHYIGAKADLLHLHSFAHCQVLQEIISPDPARIVISPHGNWIGAYGKFDIAQRMREAGRKRAAFIGQLRPYKGIDELLRTVTWLDEHGCETAIAGKPVDSSVENYIRTFSPKRTRLALRYLSDNDLHDICVHNDIGILSYRSILTSGTLMLYLSYGMNIIASGLKPGEGGHLIKTTHLYNNSEEDLLRLVASDARTLANNAYENYQAAKNEKWSDSLAVAVKKLITCKL